jgi:3-oxoadipate enol-lactonase
MTQPKWAALDGIALHYREDGDPAGAPLVFGNSLGTDLRIWDAVVTRLPAGLRVIRYDKRGHGLSDCPPAPYAMGALVRDAEMLLDRLKVREAVFVGLSIGGLIAQGLAVKRMDLLRGMVLSNTAAKIGTRALWDERIATVRGGGLTAMAPGVMERWFSPAFRATPELALWRTMFERQPAEGYVGCCNAIAGTDFLTPTSGLRLPTLAIAGDHDGATPPDLVRETADLIPGSRFELIRGAGHIPCVEAPDRYTQILTGFLREIGHI